MAVKCAQCGMPLEMGQHDFCWSKPTPEMVAWLKAMRQSPPTDEQVAAEMTWAFERHATFERFKAVVAAIRAGDKTSAAEYLRGIEAKHGRPVSEQAKTELLAAVRLWK